MTTLALDLGQFIGWMKGSTVGPIEHGTLELERTTDVGRWLASSDALWPKIMAGVDDIVVEMPFLGENYYAARKLIALLGHLYYHAHYQGIGGSRIKEVAISSGKSALCGKGNAEAPQMIAACCDVWGFEPEEIDEHQAIASGLLYYHLFGPRPKIAKARTRSSKGVVIKP